MSSSLGEPRFPLEDRFLARVRISSNRFEDWRVTAQKEIDSVLGNQRSWYYRPNDLKQVYRLVYEQEAIRGFLRSYDNSDKKDLLALAHLEITLDELIDGYHCVTTSDQRAVYAQLYGETWLDGAILRVLDDAHTEDPFHFVGLKWLAFSSPAPGIMTHRDSVFFEYSGTTQDANGRKVLFLYQKSFPLNGDELSEPDKGCARVDLFQISLFRMEGGGVLMHSVSQFLAQRDAPSWFATRAVTEAFDSIKNFVGLADARAIANAGMVKHAKTPKSASDNKACVVCKKKFGMIRSRHGCSSCGQSMCKHCITKLSFFNDEALFASAPTVLCENFCTSCIKHARSQRQLESISAELTKANISAAESRHKADPFSTTSSHAATVASPYNPSSRNLRDGLRSSIERQVGLQCDSGSDAGGLNRSFPTQYGVMHVDSPASASYASSSGTSRSVPPPIHNSVMFEQMNESIRQQEELLMVIQQERAKLHARQQYPPGAPIPTYAPPAVTLASPASPDDDTEERFQLIS